MMSKILIAVFCASGLFGSVPDSEGWVTLSEPVRLAPPELFRKGEEELAKEVVFLKKWGEEVFFLHLPEEPSYQILSSGDLEIRSGAHSLIVSSGEGEKVSESWGEWMAHEAENLLVHEGKWVSTYGTGKSVYRFETQVEEGSVEDHMALLSSFGVQGSD